MGLAKRKPRRDIRRDDGPQQHGGRGHYGQAVQPAQTAGLVVELGAHGRRASRAPRLTLKFATKARLGLRAASRALGEALADAHDDASAALIARASEIQSNHSRQDAGPAGIDDLLFRVERPDTVVICDSPRLKAHVPTSIKDGTVEVAGQPTTLPCMSRLVGVWC